MQMPQMPSHPNHPSRPERERESLLYRYVRALDEGDLDTIDEILALAMHDANLDRELAALDAGLYAEDGLLPFPEQAQLVRKLAQQYMRSGLPQAAEEDPPPVTVADVAARIAADREAQRTLAEVDRRAARRLQESRYPVSFPLTARALGDLQDRARTIQVEATETFWELFRRTATILGIGQQQRSAQLAAARRQRQLREESNQRQRSRQRAPKERGPRTRTTDSEQST